MKHRKVRELMSQPVVTLHREQSLTFADELMRIERVRHLPVVDSDDVLIGLVTHRDLLAAHLSSLNGLDQEQRTDLQLAVQVERMMTENVWSVRPDTLAVDTAQLLFDNGFGCAPVVDERQRVVGIVTEADFLDAVIDMLEAEPSGLTVADLMTVDVVTLSEEQSLWAAEDLMMLRRVRHLPVVDAARGLRGLITHRDLLAAQYSILTQAPKFPAHVRACDVMQREIWTTTPSAQALQTAYTLRDHPFGCLPVIDDDSVVGIVTEADFLALLVERFSRAQRAVPRHDMPVHQYMSTPVRSLSTEEDLERAEAMMAEYNISSLAVVTDNATLMGVISHSDLLRVSMPRLAARRCPGARHLPRRTVGEIMTPEVLSVRLDDTVAHAAQEMVTHDVHRVFVNDGSRLVGVFSTLDAMAAVRDIGVSEPVSAYMTSVIFAVSLDESLGAAIKLLDRAGVSGVIVLDKNWPVGILSQREALASRHMPRDTPVEYAMSQAFICVPGWMPLYRVAGQAAALEVRRVIVFGDDEIEGVVTGMDFARAAIGDRV